MSSTYNIFFERVFALAHQPFGLGYDKDWTERKKHYTFSATKTALNTLGAVPLVGGQLIGISRLISLVIYVASLAAPFFLFSIFQKEEDLIKNINSILMHIIIPNIARGLGEFAGIGVVFLIMDIYKDHQKLIRYLYIE